MADYLESAVVDLTIASNAAARKVNHGCESLNLTPSANATLTLTAGAGLAIGSRVVVCNKAAATYTVTVGTTSIAASTNKQFVWNGASWLAV